MTTRADVVKSVFGKALELATPAERVAFLEEACAADPALRGEVEGLLQALGKAGNFMNPASSLPGTVAGPPLVERPGAIIGPYKLLQELGEGGMGTVFLAEQTEPVRRKVALKIIKAGLDSAQVSARFEVERQALALMDHPNIAKVLDAGTTASGRPFFVMELVKGASLTTYCDENRLTPRQRLELFIPVCQAIQHAHQKGIIHRDIKPSNVLVAIYDGKPVPKVIDFGIAKATDQSLTEKTLFTRHGQIIGTFEYMSPEQATLDALDVDTRSDIYSLGVLLYELLTGTTPLDKERLRQAAFLEALRLIREEEPPRPSSRLSESRGALVAASLQRQTDADKLPGLVAGELDWIVMKSLDKDRTRRYATAGGLALDVAHYLRDEQVEACPPTAGYRLRKFIRRHRGPVLTAALVLVAVLAGIVGTSWGWVEALAQRDDAVHARREEEAQRRLATVNAAEAHRLAGEEKAARELADDERRRAVFEKTQADLFRKKAEANETKAEWRLYASQIALAQKAWEHDDVPLLHHYLKQCRPDYRGWEHDYLFTLANAGHQTWRGHTATIFHVAFSADGSLLASAGGPREKGELNLWDAASGKLVRSFEGHASRIHAVSFSPNGKQLASASGDRTVKVWDVATGKNIHTLVGHRATVWSVAYSPKGDLIASVSGKRGKEVGDAELKLWDAATGEEKTSLEGHTSQVYGVAFSPDGKQLASASMDGTVKLWDLATNQEIRTLPGPMNMAYARVAFSRDGKLLVCRGVLTIKVWDTENWREVRTIEAEGSGNAAFSPDGKNLAFGAKNNCVKLIEIASGKEIETFKAHTGPVVAVAYSPLGTHLATGGGDSTVRLWDLENRREDKPADAVLSRDGTREAKVTLDGSLQVLEVASGKPIVTLEEGFDKSARLAFSPDGKRLVSVCSHGKTFGGFPADDELKVWDLASGKALGTIKIDLVTRVLFSPDSKWLAAATMSFNDRTEGLHLWHLDSGKKNRISRGPGTMKIGALEFSPDNQRIAIAWDDSLERFMSKTKKEEVRPEMNPVELWQLGADLSEHTLSGHSAAVRGLAFSRDGKRLASASRDKKVVVWDPTSGLATLILQGHTGEVISVAFSPDGKRLASTAADRTVKLWDTTSGQEVLSLTATAGSLAFSSDGKRLFLANTRITDSGKQPTVTATWTASRSMDGNQK